MIVWQALLADRAGLCSLREAVICQGTVFNPHRPLERFSGPNLAAVLGMPAVVRFAS